MEDELGWKIMTKFVGLIAETYSYVTDVDSGGKKARLAKVCHKKNNWKLQKLLRSGLILE